MALSLFAAGTGAQGREDADAVASRIFIGQAYPSGNVYLRPFSSDGGPVATWPQVVSATPIAGERAMPVVAARFSRTLESRIDDSVMKSVYIPGAEGMDEGHDYCGLGEPAKRDPQHEILSGDFFEAIVDHCEPNDGTALYRIAPSKYSFMVIATAAPAVFTASDGRAGAIRPVTEAERQTIASLKRDALRAGADCSSEPAYRDSAIALIEGVLSAGKRRLRLSTYMDPGCAGHLTSIYLLDVIEASGTMTTVQTTRYRGAL